MSFSIGIVGLPNVGKSTLFQAVTKCAVDAQNYPFCTIDPNVGVVKVPDERLAKLSDISSSAQVIPTTIEFVDIAGLVRGAHKGEGLGNQFLANIREVDAIAQVVRAFENDDIVHVHGEVNPHDDVEVINAELILADLDTVTKRIERNQKSMKSGGDKLLKKQFEVCEKIKNALESGQLANQVELDEEERAAIKELNLLTIKPFLYIVNVNEDQLDNQPELPGIDPEYIIPISIKIEAEISELPEDEAKIFLEDMGMTESGLDKVIKASYKLLNLVTYFTSGQVETRAWTITEGTQAPQAAAKIHTDFEKGFIRAEVISYQDFIDNNGETGAKDAGALRLEGKDYIVKDGDVIHFRVAT